MVLAIGSHFVDPKDKPLKETFGWAHFEKAYARLPDLLQGSNLRSLQALLLIVWHTLFQTNIDWISAVYTQSV